MGLMSLIFGTTTIVQDSNEEHKIDKNKALAPTGEAPTPKNPGTFNSIRTIPVLHDPRYFTKEEARALKQLETQKTSEAKATKKAYKSLKKIDTADTTVHKTHRSYQKLLAANEQQKIASNACYAKKLHKLRPDYAQVEFGLVNAENLANEAIKAIKEGLM
jgi:hypothetical protein